MENEDYKNIGLTTREVNERLAKYGRNEIAMEHPSRVKISLRKFWGQSRLLGCFLVFYGWL
jgi:hypothetical protein